MEIFVKKQIDNIIEDHIFDFDHEDETPYEFISEVCYRFFALSKTHDFEMQSKIEEYTLIQLRNKLDSDYDLNIYRLRLGPLNFKQKYDL